MYLDKDSVKINGVAMGQYITSAEFQYNKMWSSDAGRNLAGTMTGTLLGIFPKIVLTFKPLTKSEINLLAPIFDSANQTVVYYDVSLNKTMTMTTYTGDWSLKNSNLMQNETFSVSFISIKKRG